MQVPSIKFANQYHLKTINCISFLNVRYGILVLHVTLIRLFVTFVCIICAVQVSKLGPVGGTTLKANVQSVIERYILFIHVGTDVYQSLAFVIYTQIIFINLDSSFITLITDQLLQEHRV